MLASKQKPQREAGADFFEVVLTYVYEEAWIQMFVRHSKLLEKQLALEIRKPQGWVWGECCWSLQHDRREESP